MDDQEANERASSRFADAPPSLVVRTGTYPFKRHQIWYRFDEPLTSAERIRGICTGLSHKLGGDPQVCNPGRVMRLAGTIAWDQKKDRRPEPTKFVSLKAPGLPAYMPEHVERVFPPLYTLEHAREQRAAPGPNVGIIRGKNSLGLETDKVVDGRELHMTNVLCARLIDYCGSFWRCADAGGSVRARMGRLRADDRSGYSTGPRACRVCREVPFNHAAVRDRQDPGH